MSIQEVNVELPWSTDGAYGCKAIFDGKGNEIAHTDGVYPERFDVAKAFLICAGATFHKRLFNMLTDCVVAEEIKAKGTGCSVRDEFVLARKLLEEVSAFTINEPDLSFGDDD